jgi:tripartite-type tricarboxylate transporter receptor subunit TctC
MAKVTRRGVLGAVAGVSGAALAPAVWAQSDWPNRPVRVVVPYAPGSGTDFIVRAMAERLSRQLGQQFVVEHRAGAAGALGTEGVAKAPADGYTILMSPQAPIEVIPHLRKLPYDALKDFVLVGRMGEVTAGFAVHPSLGVKNVAEFVALAKKQPGKITFVSAGVGSVNHLRGETLKLMAGIDLLHVPYRGNGEALPDLLAGNVHVMFDTVVFQHAKAGKLTILAVLADERIPEFPDVATMKEQGFPDFDLPIWFGTWVPAGVPRPIIERLHKEIATVHADEEFRAKQAAGGIHVYREAEGLEALAQRMTRRSEVAASLIKRANIRLE